MEETHALGLDNITLLEDDIPEKNCNTLAMFQPTTTVLNPTWVSFQKWG